MKNYKSYDNKNLQTHERKDKAKWIIAFTCIILLIVAVGFIGFSVYFDNADKQPTNDLVVEPQASISAYSNTNLATTSEVEFLASNTVDVVWGSNKVLTVTDNSATNGIIKFVSYMDYPTNVALFFSTSSSYSGGDLVFLWDGEIQSYDLDLYELIEQNKISYNTTYYLRLLLRDYDDYSHEQNLFSIRIASVEQDLPPTPSKTGYTFTGWYTDKECTIPYTSDKVTSDITLYAGWRANQYTIVFNANGADNTMSNQSMSYGTSVNLSKNTLTREGYNFVGWSTSVGGDVVYKDMQSVTNLSVEDGSTVTLYAVWERIVFTVTFIVDGQQYARVQVPYGTNLQDVINANVSTLLFVTPNLDYMNYDVTEDMSVTLQKTEFGNIVMQDWFMYLCIGIGVLVVIGLIMLFVKIAKNKKQVSRKGYRGYRK